jgi:hypothetical protein
MDIEVGGNKVQTISTHKEWMNVLNCLDSMSDPFIVLSFSNQIVQTIKDSKGFILEWYDNSVHRKAKGYFTKQEIASLLNDIVAGKDHFKTSVKWKIVYEKKMIPLLGS